MPERIVHLRTVPRHDRLSRSHLYGPIRPLPVPTTTAAPCRALALPSPIQPNPDRHSLPLPSGLVRTASRPGYPKPPKPAPSHVERIRPGHTQPPSVLPGQTPTAAINTILKATQREHYPYAPNLACPRPTVTAASIPIASIRTPPDRTKTAIPNRAPPHLIRTVPRRTQP